MPKHIVDLLTTFGIPADEATKIDALPEAEQAAFDAKPYAEKVRTNYETQFKNDPGFFSSITLENLPPEVKKKVESAQFGRASGIAIQKVLKAFGMTEADYADLPEEQKEKIELLIPHIAERYTKTKAGSKELQDQLIEARKKAEQYGPEYEKGIEAKYSTQAEQKMTAAILNSNIISDLASIPNLKIKASTLAQPAMNILSAKYGFAKDDDFSVGIRQKSNPEMKVLKPGSSQELTRLEALTEIAIAEGWVDKESKGDDKGSGKYMVDSKNGQLKMEVAPHVSDKINKKIAEEAKL